MERPESKCGRQVADILTARGALAAAHAGTRLPGSSTACVLRLNRPHRTIDAANLVRSHPPIRPDQHPGCGRKRGCKGIYCCGVLWELLRACCRLSFHGHCLWNNDEH